MSGFVEVTVQVPVNTEAEAQKMLEAVYSGMAADVLRLGVLHGFSPAVNSTPVRVETPAPSKTLSMPSDSVKQTEKSPVTRTQPKAVSKAPRGLAGRKRMGRS